MMKKRMFHIGVLPLAVAAAILQGCGGGAAGGDNGDLVAENMLVEACSNFVAAAGTAVSLSGVAYNENRMIQAMSWVIKGMATDPNMDVQLSVGNCVFSSDPTATDPTATVAPAAVTPQSVASYNWKDQKTCDASLRVGNVPTAQDIVLMLTAVDSDGHSRSDEVTITVSPNVTNLVVDAGPDVNVGAAMTLTVPCNYTAGFWYDPKNPTPAFRWYIQNAADLQLAGVNLSMTWDTSTGSLTLETPDNLNNDIDASLACEVTDESGIVAEDVATFHMKALDPLVANAGPAQIVDANQVVTLDASGTTDPANTGKSIYYQWTQLSGTAVSLSGANLEQATFISPSLADTEDLMFQVAVSREPIDDSTVFATSELGETIVRVNADTP